MEAGSISTYTTMNFANTWKDIAPLKLFDFGEFKTAVYASYTYLGLGWGSAAANNLHNYNVE